MFGFSGAHRAGKTTLARRVARNLGLHFHATSTTEILKEIGVNVVGDLPPAERLEAQNYLLTRLEDEIIKLPRPCIMDRTPLDMAGYALGEITMNNTDPELGAHYHRYLENCLRVTKRHFDSVIVVRPLPGYEVDPTKPPPNRAYQWMHQLLVEGAVMQVADVVVECLLTTSDFAQRADAATEFISERLEHLAEVAKTVNQH